MHVIDHQEEVEVWLEPHEVVALRTAIRRLREWIENPGQEEYTLPYDEEKQVAYDLEEKLREVPYAKWAVMGMSKAGKPIVSYELKYKKDGEWLDVRG